MLFKIIFQFYRNFPGPLDVDDEDMKILVEKYNDPDKPGVINYLNLHHDILAVNKFVEKDKTGAAWSPEKNVDMTALFVSKYQFNLKKKK